MTSPQPIVGTHNDGPLGEDGRGAVNGRALMIVVTEGRNFVSMGLRPELLRSVRYYCHIAIEDVKANEVLLNVRTHRVLRESEQVNIAWNDTIFFEFPPGKHKKDLELKVMCYEHSPLHDHFQGEVVLPLRHLRRYRILDQWYALARRDKRPVRGEIRLQLQLGVEVPETYLRLPSSLDTSDGAQMIHRISGMNIFASQNSRTDDKRGIGLSSPEKTFKKSIKGFRNKIKQTTMGVRGYFSEAEEASDTQGAGAGEAMTDDEVRLRERAYLLHNQFSPSRVDGNSTAQFGQGLARTLVDESFRPSKPSSSKQAKPYLSLRRKKSPKGYESSGGIHEEGYENRRHSIEYEKGIAKGWSSATGIGTTSRIAVDERGELLGTITPTKLTEEELEEEVCSEGHASEGDEPQQLHFEHHAEISPYSRPVISITQASPQLSKDSKRSSVSLVEKEDAVISDEEVTTLQSPFKKTIKRAVIPSGATPESTGGLLPEGQLFKRTLKSSGDSYSSSKSQRKRLKEVNGASQRLALLRRYPNYETKSKAAIIDQRQRAYHAWLDAYHHEVDEFFNDTRDWKVAIEMQQSDKIDYATVNKEWKRPWRKDMKRARETRDHLQGFINDEMQAMDDIIDKISNRARSHFEQPSLFPASAVSAMQTLEHEGRRRREREKKKARRNAHHAQSSPSSSPSSQRRIGPLVPTPSVPPETPGHRPLLVVLVTLLILYILNRFM